MSADLIFALPESLEQRLGTGRPAESWHWASTTCRCTASTVEAHTPLGRWRERERGTVAEAPDEVYEAEFLKAREVLTGAGFEHYEVSNYARPGRRSRHNSAYWSGVTYVGAGPSAHGFDGVRRVWNVPAYAEWVRKLAGGESVVGGVEALTDENRTVERVYLGLRTCQGLEASDAELAIARGWVDQGWAEIIGRTIVLTAMGWLRLDALATSLTLAASAW